MIANTSKKINGVNDWGLLKIVKNLTVNDWGIFEIVKNLAVNDWGKLKVTAKVTQRCPPMVMGR